MKKIIIGAIILIVVIIISSLSVIIVSTDKGLITGDDGLDPGDPDSNPGTDPEDITIAIRFDEPVTDEYYVPEKTNFHSMPIKGTLYGTEIETIDHLEFCWNDNIQYSKRSMELGDTGEYYKCEKYDTYNYIWETRMEIIRLGSGDHTLRARAIKNGAIASEATINVNIPEKYIYTWDSRSTDRNDSYDDGSYYYKFCMPFQSYFPNDQSWYWLQGQVIKITGSIHVSSTWENGPSEVWLNFWNSQSDSWTTVKKEINIDGPGWHTVDIDCNNNFASWISFAGSSADGYGADPHDEVVGFVGEIWVKPGTQFYSQNPLEIVFSFFNFDSINSPPGP